MMTCQFCEEPLRFVTGRGYVHQEGGTYVMRCPDCGWRGAPYPSAVSCPSCGSKAIRDDHCATAVIASPTRPGAMHRGSSGLPATGAKRS